MKHELTLTLRPLLYTRTPLEQFNTVTPLLRVALHGYKYSMVAELTKEFNIHYHGIIDIHGPIQKNALLNKLRPLNRFLGRKRCEAVRFEESYENYIKADLKETQQIVTDPVVKDDYKLFQKDIFSAEHRQKQDQALTGLEGSILRSKKDPLPPQCRAENPDSSPLDYGIDFTEQKI